MKKNGKKSGSGWKKIALCSIVCTLFAVLCVSIPAKEGGVDASVQLADPETEARLAADREELARRKAEIEKLRTENIQKTAENAQKTAEISSLRSALSRNTAEKERLQSEAGLLKKQNRDLRKELLDTLERSNRTSERLKRLEQSAAGVLERLGPVYTGRRESELAGDLDTVLKSGLRLVNSCSAVCELLLPEISRLGLNTVKEARLRVALEELVARNRAFARLSLPPADPGKFEKCRILEVLDHPGAVILNAGYRDGVRANLQMRTGSGTEMRVLHVIAVRPFISAAMPEDGSLQGLSAGMEVRASSESGNKEEKKK